MFKYHVYIENSLLEEFKKIKEKLAGDERTESGGEGTSKEKIEKNYNKGKRKQSIMILG